MGGSARQVQARDIRLVLRQGAIDDALEASGYDLSRIGSHSLRSGGAVVLKLAGHNSNTIEKLGRWSSDTYLTYIQTQIGQLTAHVASTINSQLRYVCVG